MTPTLMFSAAELELLSNDQLFILKSNLSKKLSDLFVQLSEELKKELNQFENSLAAEVNNSLPKISRGENYKGFPWMVLDYPRIFSQEDVFAFRSLCWWGHEFSFTLHLGGKYLDDKRKVLPHILSKFNFPGIYICMSDSPWHYYFEKDNYVLLADFLSQQKHISSWVAERTFIKISKKTALDNYTNLTDEGSTFLHLLLTELTR